MSEQDHVENLITLAKLGNVEAMRELGFVYLKGIDVEKNIHAGIVWLTKAANKNDIFAIDLLTDLYYQDENFKDEKKAFDIARLGARLTSKRAMYNLAKFYLNGIGTKPNIKKALKWSKKVDDSSASYCFLKMQIYQSLGDKEKANMYLLKGSKCDDFDDEHKEMLASLGITLESEELNQELQTILDKIEEDYEEGKTLLVKAIKDGEVTFDESVEYLGNEAKKNPQLFGLLVELNDGLIDGKRDLKQKVYWAERGIEYGYEPNYADLAEYYILVGTKEALEKANDYLFQGTRRMQDDCIALTAPFYFKDYSETNLVQNLMLACMRKEAKEKNAKICDVLVNLMYNFGVDSENYKEMRKLARIGEKEGYMKSTAILGKLLFDGHDIKPQYPKACSYLRRASEEDPEACKYLGKAYLYGKGVKQNTETSLKWYIQSNEMEPNKEICLIVSMIYQKGIGINKNETLETMYYKKAEKLYGKNQSQMKKDMDRIIKELENEMK